MLLGCVCVCVCVWEDDATDSSLQMLEVVGVCMWENDATNPSLQILEIVGVKDISVCGHVRV